MYGLLSHWEQFNSKDWEYLLMKKEVSKAANAGFGLYSWTPCKQYGSCQRFNISLHPVLRFPDCTDRHRQPIDESGFFFSFNQCFEWKKKLTLFPLPHTWCGWENHPAELLCSDSSETSWSVCDWQQQLTPLLSFLLKARYTPSFFPFNAAG